MMLSGVLAKTVRDRWVAFAVGAVTLGLFMLFGMAVYGTIDLSIYEQMPPALRALIGIGDTTDAAGLAYGAIYAAFGALTIAGIAIWAGAASIAGEERNGTIGILLGNPKSRTHVLLANAAALILLTGIGAAILFAAGVLSPLVLGADIGGRDVLALVVHMFVNSLFYGFLALAIGAWTGNGGLAAGVSAMVMVISYLAVGLLPLVEGLADLARVLPWYYFDHADPELNGIGWGDLAILAGASAVFTVVALVGVNRRDLRGRSVGRSILDRLRTNPLTRRVVERLAGTAAVSRIWIKTTTEYQGLVIVSGAIMFWLGLMLGPLYSLIPEEVLDFADQFPKEFLALVGNGDFSTAEGWYQLENFSIMAPFMVMLVTIAVGARALAGEEGSRTMGLLLANPVPRSRIVLEKSVAMVLLAITVGIAIFAGTAIGSVLPGLDMDLGNIAAISLLVTLLGLAFGGLALALGAATGRVSVAVQGTVGVALLGYVLNSFLPLSESLAEFARLSPFYYYLTGDPLNAGLDWTHAGLLAGLFVGFVALSVYLFERRDLRQTG